MIYRTIMDHGRLSKMPLLASVLLIFIAGCTVGSDYQRPELVMPYDWGETTGAGVTSSPQQIIQWWTLFQDKTLNSLIDRAVGSNKDLQLAGARIREARAQWRMAGAEMFPKLETSGSYTHQRQSENASTDGSESGTHFPGDQDLFQIGFDAGWEIDVFGGVRRTVEAAEAEIDASKEGRRDVLITLLAEVATNYVELRAGQRRIAISRENIKLQQETLELTRGRFEAGLTGSLEVAQAEALLRTTESRLPTIENSVIRAIHRIGVLIGQQPDALSNELLVEGPIPPVPPQVPIGLPSDLLRRRPDVRRAERLLAAQTARVGVATADLFPKFSLTGIAGLKSLESSDLVSGDSRFYSIGPTVNWPVFEGGRIRANIEVQDAREEQALLTYESAILNSLEDAKNAIVAYSKEQATFQSLGQAVEASRRADEIARELYSKGLVDFLNVLLSQGALRQVEDQYIQSEQRVSTLLVALFKALGGGWEIGTNQGEKESGDRKP
jgi:outer membrane protein, multidrug efflux system